jgi:predicted acyltransferase
MAITGSVDSETQKSRYLSLDTLRGFDMFWIIGARSLATGLASLNLPGICVITGQLYHTKWNGFTFCDLIFPLFIFIMGVSLVLSLQKRVERGDNRGSLVRHVLTRTVILFIMGLVVQQWSRPPTDTCQYALYGCAAKERTVLLFCIDACSIY